MIFFRPVCKLIITNQCLIVHYESIKRYRFNLSNMLYLGMRNGRGVIV